MTDIQDGGGLDLDSGKESSHSADQRWFTRRPAEDNLEAIPAEGLRHAASLTETEVFVPEYFFLDYHASGLTVEPWFARNAGIVGTGDADSDAAVDLDAEGRRAALQGVRDKAVAERTKVEKR